MKRARSLNIALALNCLRLARGAQEGPHKELTTYIQAQQEIQRAAEGQAQHGGPAKDQMEQERTDSTRSGEK